MSKKPHRARVLNHTRYFTLDLELLIGSVTKHDWVFEVKHFVPKKDALFRGSTHALFVKTERNTRSKDNTHHIRIAKPTGSGQLWARPGVGDLEALACFSSNTAPIALRRQLLWRVMDAMEARYHDGGRYSYTRYTDERWHNHPLQLRYLTHERTKENIAWQKLKLDRAALLQSSDYHLNYARRQVAGAREQIDNWQGRLVKRQAEAEEALEAALIQRREYTLFKFSEPDPDPI